jgi:hypothetical protein
MGAYLSIIAKLGSLALVGMIIYMIGGSIYYAINRDDPDIVPPEWWPDFWRDIIHNFPPNYKMVSNVLVTGTLSNTYTSNVMSAYDCASREDAGCNDADGCIGFVYQSGPTANTCMLYSTITTPFIDSRITGNTLYVIEGNEPAKTYQTYVSNVVGTTTTRTTIPSYISTNYFDCASNCTSNTSCTGFQYQSTTNSCEQQTSIVATNLGFNTQFTSYILQTATLATATI